MTFQSSPRSGRACADRHHHETGFLLRTLRRHPLFVGTAEVLVDAIRYVAVVLIVLTALAQAARLAF